MKELVVISGKGGTGKTSIVAAFATLAKNIVLADCDVDASDLHLILEPKIINKNTFKGGKKSKIDTSLCEGCEMCRSLCKFNAISLVYSNNENKTISHIDPISCEGCGVCAWFCPNNAIEFKEVINGDWFISDTRHGPMVHAELGIAQENSGKLVSLIRNKSQEIAKENNYKLVVIDGSPGIGCPVIASITGASFVLIVAEPTLSGIHDMERVIELTFHFKIKTGICINKWDINKDISKLIKEKTDKMGLKILGKISYDPNVTKAQIVKKSIIEYTKNGISEEIIDLWKNVEIETKDDLANE